MEEVVSTDATVQQVLKRAHRFGVVLQSAAPLGPHHPPTSPSFANFLQDGSSAPQPPGPGSWRRFVLSLASSTHSSPPWQVLAAYSECVYTLKTTHKRPNSYAARCDPPTTQVSSAGRALSDRSGSALSAL